MAANANDIVQDRQAANGNHQGNPNPYEPDKLVKRTYLLLRKNGATFARLKLPGLFGYHRGHDRLALAISFLLEVFLSLILMYLARNKYNEAIAGILAILATIVLLDYSFCLGRQFWVVRKRAEKENRKLLMTAELSNSNNGYTVYKRALDAKYSDRKLSDAIFKLLIWGFALGRMVIFINLAKGSSVFHSYLKESGSIVYVGLIFLSLLYVCIALIHTHHTGYALCSFWHNFFKKRHENNFFHNLIDRKHEPFRDEKHIDLRGFVASLKNDPDIECRSLIDYPDAQIEQDIAKGFVTDDIVLARDGRRHTGYTPHQIVGDPSKPACCTMRCVGFLDDDSLYKMIRVQDTDIAKYAIALYGVSIQLGLLENENRRNDT